MKNILAAIITTLLLLYSASAHAQLTATSDPSIPVKRMTPQQREEFVMATKSADPTMTPEQVKQFKDAYAGMSELQQQQVAIELVKKMQDPLKKIDQAMKTQGVMPSDPKPTPIEVPPAVPANLKPQ